MKTKDRIKKIAKKVMGGKKGYSVGGKTPRLGKGLSAQEKNKPAYQRDLV